MSSGALTPIAAVQTIYHDAIHHLDEPAHLAFIKNIAGGMLLSLSGLTALTIAGSCPGLESSNSGIVNLIEGSIFSTGLVFVYLTGAELFTGYPMWLAIAALKRKGKARQYVTATMTSFFGNLVGALFIAVVIGYLTGQFEEEAPRAYVAGKVDEEIVGKQWHVVFLKAMACGYLVTFAMLMGTQNMDGISKAMALWLPFAVASIAQFPHTVKYMQLAPLGMMLGSRLSIGAFIWKCLLPITLGNIVGGGLFTGAYHWWVFLYCNNGERKTGSTFEEAFNEYQDEEE